MQNKAKLTFCGGTGSVTGANFLFEIDGKKILIDCGLTQGSRQADELNWEPFQYDPESIDMLFVTHAHIDHIGRIPKLIDDGFNGNILSTIPTKSLMLPMLQDTAYIMSMNNDRNKEIDLEAVYSDENLRKTLNNWTGYKYHEKIKVTDELEVSFHDAGHILGSAMVKFSYKGKNFLFTGDLGNSPSPILPDTEKMTDIDYLVMESVYGDRNHESRDDRKKKLERVIEDNYKRKGALLVPTFSLERSQELLFELNDLVENKRIPPMPIFFDSPLAIKVTDIFKQYKEYLNENAKTAMIHDKYIFDFPGLRETLHTKDSKMIRDIPNPKIIIAGSGMSTGGRIVHHERHYLPDPSNTILLTGYQTMGSLGRLIQEGMKTVKITGEQVRVRAHVETIFGYSSHKDSDRLLEFVHDSADRLKKVFTVMGEPKSAMFLAQKIKDNLGIEAHAPERNQSVVFDLS
jgi:metallo-beta-lactamase family protein